MRDSSYLCDSSKAPSIGLANERRELGMFKVRWYDSHLKLSRLQDPPSSTMRHPRDDIHKIRSTEDRVHLCRKVWHSSWGRERRQWIGIGHVPKVAIVKVRKGSQGAFARSRRLGGSCWRWCGWRLGTERLQLLLLWLGILVLWLRCLLMAGLSRLAVRGIRRNGRRSRMPIQTRNLFALFLGGSKRR